MNTTKKVTTNQTQPVGCPLQRTIPKRSDCQTMAWIDRLYHSHLQLLKTLSEKTLRRFCSTRHCTYYFTDTCPSLFGTPCSSSAASVHPRSKGFSGRETDSFSLPSVWKTDISPSPTIPQKQKNSHRISLTGWWKVRGTLHDLCDTLYPVFTYFHSWVKKAIMKVTSRSSTYKALQYRLNQEEYLRFLLTDGNSFILLISSNSSGLYFR